MTQPFAASRLVTGKVFNRPALMAAPPEPGPTKQSILLYPDTPGYLTTSASDTATRH